MKQYLLAPGPTPFRRRLAGHGAAHDPSPDAGVRSALRGRAPGPSAALSVPERGPDVRGLGDGRHGRGGGEHPLPGDQVIVVQGGKFGERWAEICQAYGLRVVPVDVPYGKSVMPAAVAAALREAPDSKAVFATQSETSTGAVHDIQALAGIVRETGAILVVDAITSLGVMDLPMDAWGVDIVVSGSQKALMLPPGLAFAALSDKAWARVPEARLPKFYFNFAGERKAIAENQSAYTPAVSLVVGLRESLRLILAEGLPNVFARHERLARATRAGVQALGLTLFAAQPGAACTAVKAPGRDRRRRHREGNGHAGHHHRRRPGQHEGRDVPDLPHGLCRCLRCPDRSGRPGNGPGRSRPSGDTRRRDPRRRRNPPGVKPLSKNSCYFVTAPKRRARALRPRRGTRGDA